MRKLGWLAGIVAVLGLAGWVAWQQRTTLQAWYYVHQLAQASDAEQQPWRDRLLQLGGPAVPRLLSCLESGEPTGSARAKAVLEQMVRDLPDLASRAALANRLVLALPKLNGRGQVAVLDVWAAFLPPINPEPSPDLIRLTHRILTETARSPVADVRWHGLELMGNLLAQGPLPDLLPAARDMAQRGLASGESAERVRAIGIALRPELELLEQVTPLLNDPEPAVRRKAMAAVSSSADAIRTDELLHWLHDPDSDVRRLCEAALTWRGLTPTLIQRGRWLTDPRPAVRMQVLQGLTQVTDLEPSVWLRHLSHDPEPAVRVAAVRAAAEQGQEELIDRLEQMARDDPSDTVRQLSRFYLTYQKSRRP